MNLTTIIGGTGMVLMSFFSSSSWADDVKTLGELAMLPPYCRGVFQVRDISKDPIAPSYYGQIYGPSYAHLHHYCWALNGENKANTIFDKHLRNSELIFALKDIEYVLTNASPDFVLLPDIYNSQARILFKLHRDSEAVLSLEKAIELKPGYVPAVARLSDYFAGIGDKEKAIQTLKNGIDNTENAGFLISKLAKLGVTYQGTPGSAIKQEESVATPAANEAAPASSVPAASYPPGNPYCRFCP